MAAQDEPLEAITPFTVNWLKACDSAFPVHHA